MLGHAAHDELRILIVDGAAGIAHMAGDEIARGDAKFDPGAALLQKFMMREEDKG